MDLYSWNVEGRHGKETWKQEGRRFSVSEVNDRSATDADIVDLLGVKRCQDATCTASLYYPLEFHNCPACRGGLVPVVDPSTPAWCPPYGNIDGTRMMGQYRWILNSPKERKFPLPLEGGRFAFIVPGREKYLIALDRIHGIVFYYSAIRRDWFPFGKIPPSGSIPLWAWSAAPSVGGIAVQTDVGPAWIPLPKFGDEQEPVLGGEGEGLLPGGGVAILGDVAVMPVRQNGRIALAWRNGRDQNPWALEPVGDEEALLPEGDFLGVAARKAGGDIVWPGKKGFLVLRSQGGRLRSSWQAFPDGQVGCRDYPLYRDQNSELWQMCRIEDPSGRRYVFARMSTGVRDLKGVGGVHISVGGMTFSGDKRYEMPWDENRRMDFFPHKDYVVLPLISLENGLLYASIKNESFSGRFFENEADYVATLYFRKADNQGEVILLDPFTLKSPWDISAFLFEGALHVYLDSQRICYCWGGKIEMVKQ